MSSGQKIEKKSVYSQAFVIGKRILCESYIKYNKETAKSILLKIIKELRREMLPERFRFKLTQLLIDVASSLDMNITLPSELKIQEPLKLVEFYRISSLILMGFWDAYSAFSSKPDSDIEVFCKEK